MKVTDVNVGDWVEMTNDGGCFHGKATRYGRVVELLGGDALIRFGRMMFRMHAGEDATDCRKMGCDEIAAMGLA